MKIAIASDRGMVTQHFGHCEHFHIYEVDGKEVVNSEKVKIYENQDNLVIESDKIFNRVVVYDVTGKLLKSIESGNKNSLLIEKSQLSRGIYLINIIFADKIVNKKISFK